MFIGVVTLSTDGKNERMNLRSLGATVAAERPAPVGRLALDHLRLSSVDRLESSLGPTLGVGSGVLGAVQHTVGRAVVRPPVARRPVRGSVGRPDGSAVSTATGGFTTGGVGSTGWLSRERSASSASRCWSGRATRSGRPSATSSAGRLPSTTSPRRCRVTSATRPRRPRTGVGA